MNDAARGYSDTDQAGPKRTDSSDYDCAFKNSNDPGHKWSGEQDGAKTRNCK